MAIEIPRDKLLNVGEKIQTLAKSNNSSESWASLIKEIIENIPEGVAMVKGIIKDVKEVKAMPKKEIVQPTYDEAPKGEKIIVIDNRAKAENIFNGLMNEAGKHKVALSTMNGNKLLEMAKGFKEIIIGKIEGELDK
ncbi:MAG: hypothetical protein OQK82_02100 [Candidatus Pacearchaeota archaeon]|nr:hypothetical protein [Candidatus Pacearchaeota archaeon]